MIYSIVWPVDLREESLRKIIRVNLILILGVSAIISIITGDRTLLQPGPRSSSRSAGAAAERRVPATRLLESAAQRRARIYRWHRGIVSTTFWVGEISDPTSVGGSQVISTYDDNWEEHYGGCDGRVVAKKCWTERRYRSNGYFPRHMQPHENPFYLDLPYDDVNDRIGARERAKVVPWAHDKAYASVLARPGRSLLKNSWVEIRRNGRTCFGQVEDAGPGTYHDAPYVFGASRPANRLYNDAGMDVSPALNACLSFSELNGDGDRVAWRFVNSGRVPSGPWTRVVTT